MDANNEQVEYDIILRAGQAMKDLQTLTAQATTFKEKVDMVSASLNKFAAETGMSVKNAASVFKEIDGIMSDTVNGSATFGKLQKQGWDEATRGAQNFGKESKSAIERALTGMNGFRIALGAIISMLLFQGIQAIQQFFQTAIKNASELEAALYRIHNAERILSQEGLDVSTKGLEEGILRIKKLLPIFSKEDIAGLVGQIAITTKSLGLNEQQILDLAQAYAILNVNSSEEESLQQTAQKGLSSLLTSNAKGVAGLSIQLGDAALKAQGLKMGFLEAGESASDLTAHEKGLVKVAITIDAANSSINGLNEYLNTNTGRLQANKAAWNDLLTTIGQVILPFIPAFTALFEALTDVVNYGKTAIAVWGATFTTVLTVLRMLLGGSIHSFKELQQAIRDVAEEAKKLVFRQLFPEGVPENAPKWFKDKFAPYLQPNETPTGPNNITSTEEEQAAQENQLKAQQEYQSKLQDILKDSADKKLDIERDYQRKLEDINRNYAEKLEDIARNTAQKKEDALRTYNQKVEDINRDAADKIAAAQADARQKEIDREQEFQNKLRELREKFLFDLEDALRERDARQVLRLIRQYNMDKNNLEERHKLDRAQAKKDLAAKLQDIELEKQKKLEAARREYDERLRDIQINEQRERAEANLWRSRQLADARLWYQRQLQEQQQYLQRKLRDLAEALKAEYKLTSQGMQAINGLLSSGYNLPAGYTPVTSGGAVVGGSSNGFPNFADTMNTLTSGGGYGYAEGGSLIATRPTKAMFGEKGPERVDITPLGKPGNNVGKTFGDKSFAGIGGDAKITLELSPDLEARLMDNTLDSVAVHLERVSREK